MSSSPRRASSSTSKGGASDNKKKKSFSYPKQTVVPAPKPLDTLFSSQDVVRSLAVPPNLAVKVAESANVLYAAHQQQQKSSKSSSNKQQNKANNARSSLQDALENVDGDAVGRMHHANLVVSTFANTQLASTRQTLQQYVGLFHGAREEAAKLEEEMEERDRDAVRVVDFLRKELEEKHIQHQKLIQDHKVELQQMKEANEKENASLKTQLEKREQAVSNLKKEVERLQGELDMVAEFRRERIQLHHEHTRHIEAEEQLTQKFEREITSLKFQNLEDRLRLRAVENEMCEKFQSEVHAQASKLVDAKGRAIREENDQLRSHTMRLHSEVEELTNAVDEKNENLQHTQREVELSLQTQGEYARRSVIQSKTAKDAIEKVKQLQSELSTSQREAKSIRLREKQQYEDRIKELQHKLDGAHASLVAHRRDLLKTRNLAKRLVAQRSELEQFFYDALQYVNTEKEREFLIEQQAKLDVQDQNLGGFGKTARKRHRQQHEKKIMQLMNATNDTNKKPSTAGVGGAPIGRNASSLATASDLHRRTMTNELKVLPDPIRKVVSARRDIGYRGDLDAAVVPTEGFNTHSGLHAQSARIPQQGCFSSQSDFAVPRTNQFFITQKEPVTQEYSRETTEAYASPTRSMTASVREKKEKQILGVLSDHRRQFYHEQQQQQQQQRHDDDNNLQTTHDDNQHVGVEPVDALYPEMHQAMKDAEKTSNDFRQLSWYDKEKVISAMLHHLNRSTLENRQHRSSSSRQRNNNDENLEDEFPFVASSNQASVGDFYTHQNQNQDGDVVVVDSNFENVPIVDEFPERNDRPSTSQQQQQSKTKSNNINNNNNRRLYDGEEDDPFPAAPTQPRRGLPGTAGGESSQTSSEFPSRAQTADTTMTNANNNNTAVRSRTTVMMNQYFGGTSGRSSAMSSSGAENQNQQQQEAVSWENPTNTTSNNPRRPQIPRPPPSGNQQQQQQTARSSSSTGIAPQATPRPSTQPANNNSENSKRQTPQAPTPTTASKKKPN